MRQIRKTRGRDAQSAEKLQRLRKELEEARQLVALVRQREVARKEMLAMERTLFMQRNEVKEMKRKLNIKDDDEDLINQKVSSMTASFDVHPRILTIVAAQEEGDRDASSATQCAPASHAPQAWSPGRRGFATAGGRAIREGERDPSRYQGKYRQAYQVERGFCGSYPRATSPSPERTFDAAAFRPAFTAQLPTPPSSESSGDVMDSSLDVTSPLFSKDKLASRAMVLHDEPHRMPSFRRRVGRGGRLFIDRRNLVARCRVELDPLKADRFKYDQEDSDEEPTYDTDAYSIQIMQHRAITMAKAREQAAVAAQAHAQAQAQAAQQRRLQADQAGNPQGANPVPNGVTVSSEAS